MCVCHVIFADTYGRSMLVGDLVLNEHLNYDLMAVTLSFRSRSQFHKQFKTIPTEDQIMEFIIEYSFSHG